MLTPQMNQEIIQKAKKGGVLIVVGATGSGKSTGIPQALLSTTNDLITVTQPRRVAAISLASHVKRVITCVPGDKVGHKVRFSDTTNKNTRLRYVTDGILLKELQEEAKLSTVVVDEVHERSIRTDILLGLLKKRINGIRLVLMSATADVNMLTEYFAKDGIPVSHCEIPSQKHDVRIKYLPKKSSDYIQLAYDTIKKIIKDAKTERESTNKSKNNENSRNAKPSTGRQNNSKCSAPKSLESRKKKTPFLGASSAEGMDEIDCLFSGVSLNSYNPVQEKNDVFTSGTILVFLSGLEDIEDLYKMLEVHSGIELLKLHSSLPDKEQQLIFTQRQKSIRVILSTNIAETSLTIEDVKWVVDAGVQKTNLSKEGVDTLGIIKISKSAAKQRSGRAGRVGPGVCYRLYTEEAYNGLQENNIPEILRADISSVTLSLIALDADPEKFDFLESPGENSILSALSELFILGLISDKKKITALGKEVSKLPLSPSLGKFLIHGKSLGAGCSAAAVCSLLSGERISLFPKDIDTSSIISVHESPTKCSDLSLYASVFFTYFKYSPRLRKDFCQSLKISQQEMKNSENIYRQLLSLMKIESNAVDEETEKEETGYGCTPLKKNTADKLHAAASAGFLIRVAEAKGNGYVHMYSERMVYIHPSSVMFARREGLVSFIITSETAKPYILHVFPYTPNILMADGGIVL
ncbi:uncharacterized protein NEPG_02225 [Nematocida parisii ERTm1]|uniref:Uncharacterized protein n=1 Tax=Nematocida parisii (strain ERTm3) TaxID=935791 RepID=I3EEF1_NEMP3|nr:uncharacterized protein NEPG_02225 [Nematocida parisii ERTm1]EIJ87598.1 hypothetical protein NEQG_02145 [Nematocida parisii ERTm3]EIJ92826.1 hypothetical protein NEPG_02225 [Nematocida parisii ERTm1]|eukprot:XP_013060052.1 hypothetical protein NEPG_02225 [Nematocida parisii ERTm1]